MLQPRSNDVSKVLVSKKKKEFRVLRLREDWMVVPL